MEIRQVLTRQEYELDKTDERGEDYMEVWINRGTGRGVLVEWFTLPDVRR
jgi:hypothetical protein